MTSITAVVRHTVDVQHNRKKNPLKTFHQTVLQKMVIYDATPSIELFQKFATLARGY